MRRAARQRALSPGTPQLWLEEPLTLRAFRSLLGMGRFFGVPDNETLGGSADRERAATSRR